MITNSNQNVNRSNLIKHIVRTYNIEEISSFRLSNFKIYKLYTYSNNKIKNKFHYNLNFVVFLCIITQEFIVILIKTRNITNLTTLEFDNILIKRRNTYDN